MRKIILDTDIGTDVDDAMALMYLLNQKDVDVLGISTAYGDTKLRGQIVCHYLDLLRRKIPVYAGATRTLSGRQIWMSGREGALHGDLTKYELSDKNGVDFLIEAVNDYPNEIDIVAIAPLTNIALAIQKDPSFASKVRQLQIMGGDFEREFAEHNFRADVAALRIVMESKIPTTIIPLNITRLVAIPLADFEFLAESGLAEQLLFAEIKGWLEFRKEVTNNPHDPINLLALLHPEFFEFSEWGNVEIQVESGELRFTHFREREGGTVRIAQRINLGEVSKEVIYWLSKHSV